jgi:hypothetical protein
MSLPSEQLSYLFIYFSPARDTAVVLLSRLSIFSADLPPWNMPLLLPFLHALLPRMRHHDYCFQLDECWATKATVSIALAAVLAMEATRDVMRFHVRGALNLKVVW